MGVCSPVLDKTFIQSRSSLKKHTRFQTKLGNVYTRFQTTTAQNPTRWGDTYLYSLYKGVHPPGSNVSHAGTSDVLDLYKTRRCGSVYLGVIVLRVLYFEHALWQLKNCHHILLEKTNPLLHLFAEPHSLYSMSQSTTKIVSFRDNV